jgi:hypothetical protein
VMVREEHRAVELRACHAVAQAERREVEDRTRRDVNRAVHL